MVARVFLVVFLVVAKGCKLVTMVFSGSCLVLHSGVSAPGLDVVCVDLKCAELVCADLVCRSQQEELQQ